MFLALVLPSRAFGDEPSTPSPAARESALAAERFAFVPVDTGERSVRWIQSGVRVERLPDGAMLVADERLEGGGAPAGVELPAELGGGFVVHQSIADAGRAGTAIYRASSWTARLEPLAFVPFVVTEVTPLVDRLALRGGGHRIALDLATGRWLPLVPLPRVATIEALFRRGDEIALSAPLVGELVSRDGGVTFAPRLPTGTSVEPRYVGGAARVRPVRAPKSWLEEAVRSGVPWGRGRALVLATGDLVLLETNGRVLSRSPVVDVGPLASCRGFPGKKGAARALFVCTSSRDGQVETLVLGAEGDASVSGSKAPVLRVFVRFSGSRRVLASSSRGLVLAGGRTSERGTGCFVDERGQVRSLVRAPRSDESVGVTERGEAEVVAVQLLRRERRFEVSPLLGVGSIRKHSLPDDDGARRAVESGVLVGSVTDTPDGLAFFVAFGDRFVGVKLPTGSSEVEFGSVQTGLGRTAFAAERALSWGAAGFAKLTLDAGQTYSEVPFPYRSGDPDPSVPTSVEAPVELGCGPLGCRLGNWLLVGSGEAPRVERPRVPDKMAIPPPGGGRYRFDCRSVRRLSHSVLSTRGGSAPPPGSSSLGASQREPFFEWKPPALSGGQRSYSVETSDARARLDAFGPEQGRWREGTGVQVVFRSPFSTERVLTTLSTAGLVEDALGAERTLGLLDRVSRSAEVELDVGGQAGILLVRRGSESDLVAFAAERPVALVPGLDAFGVRSLAGVALVGAEWYFGAIVRDRFVVFGTNGRTIEPRIDVPLGSSGARGVRLVRSTAFDLGVYIEGDTGTLVYPLERAGTGAGESDEWSRALRLGEPVFTPFQGHRPAVCGEQAAGYLVEEELSVSPFVGVGDRALEVGRVRARLLLGYGNACLVDLAATGRGELEVPTGQRGPEAVPLVVTETGSGQRRTLLSCE